MKFKLKILSKKNNEIKSEKYYIGVKFSIEECLEYFKIAEEMEVVKVKKA